MDIFHDLYHQWPCFFFPFCFFRAFSAWLFSSLFTFFTASAKCRSTGHGFSIIFFLNFSYCEKLPAEVGVGIIVDAGSINIEHFAPENLFRGTYVPDAGKQLIEIVASARLLEPFVVQDKSFDDIFPQVLGRPYAKLGACLRQVKRGRQA